MACLVPQACRPLSKPPRRGSTGLDGLGGGGGQPNGGWWTHDWAKVGWWGNQNVSTPGSVNELDGTADDPELPSNRTRNRTRSGSFAVKKTSFSCNDLAALRDGHLGDGAAAAAEEAAGIGMLEGAADAEMFLQEVDDPDRKRRVLFSCHGSRGDVQPLVALAIGFRERGYDVAFWTVRPVNQYVERQGFKCYVHELDTDELMRRVQLKVDKIVKVMGPGLGFFHAMTQVMEDEDIRPKVDMIPEEVLKAHLDYRPDLSITSHCMPTISCAEKLHIPVIYMALQPMFPTKEFPPFAFASRKLDDRMSWLHKPLGHIFMSIYENQTYMKGVKRCRELAGLPIRRFQDGTPVYNLRFVPTCTVVSNALVRQPEDWPKWQKICGFLGMKTGTEDIWEPSEELLAFLEGGAPPVYIGFGSMCGDEEMAVRLTRLCLTALRNTESRGVLLGGWAGMTRERLDPEVDSELIAYAEAHIFELPAAPHTWLFPKCGAVVHHGGAGTLAAGLKAGCPTVICPFIFDQQYFGGLVTDNKLGLMTSPARDLTVEELSGAISTVTTDEEMRANALEIGTALMEEDGVTTSIDFIEEIVQSFPFPWTIKNANFKRDEPRWTDERFAHVFSQSDLLDSLN
mmetsp:Transcript_40771/g.93810  ORF Transcript_40771/g.93810 Transcript_40771/m.93810 type:complete len:626 (-) Transcript_40771:234-2111(-)|eukprot:CAMPEP_0182598186 /NCGR_PEP_ID=MMETSP1324-20130603/87689_1 /TAXON_ID=236786 /ORGANISM="Florenciella sp., Strain RCC1587" /LENGTH=625 /DNA_ID=CAMNT_0024816003 /DNA_START=210 /DNA_END=2087 /DNA_ORIENTATION=+